jgi:DNA-binding NtrC family response regulator
VENDRWQKNIIETVNMERERHKILVIDDEIGTPDSPERTAFLRAVGYYPSTGGKKQVEGYPYAFDFHTGQSEAGINSVEAVKDSVLRSWPSPDGKRWALVLLDVRFGRDEKFGFTLLRALREDSRFDSDLPVVMLTSEGKGKKDEAGKLDADGFFPKADESGKPLWNEEGLRQRVLEFGLIPDDRDKSCFVGSSMRQLVGGSLALLKCLREARAYALDPADTRILYGETGVGKSELAGYIHCFAGRKGLYVPFVADPSAKELQKTELFGCWKGAHSMASAHAAGKIERAHGGTFFLDEVANLPVESQMLLLQFRDQDERGWRTLTRTGDFPPPQETKEVSRAMASIVAGAEHLIDHRIRVDVLFLTGTNIDLEDVSVRKAKGFLDDLHFALGNPLQVPNLNERKEDIRNLFLVFVKRALAHSRSSNKTFEVDDSVYQLLEQRNWTKRGNLRDLNRIARHAAHKLGDFDIIRLKSLPPDVREEAQRSKSPVGADKDVEANGISASVESKQAPIANEGSSAHGSLTRAELEHLRRRASLLEEAAEATRKIDPAGTKGRYQPQVAVSRLMGNSVTGSNAERIIRTNIIGPILKPKKKMMQAYGKNEIQLLQEWVKSRPVLMSLYRYSTGEIKAHEIHEHL